MAAGDVALYWVASELGVGGHRLLRSGRIGRARGAFEGRFSADPAGMVLAARFVPLGRIATDLLAAEVRLGGRRFTRAVLPAALIWSAACCAVGALVGRWDERDPLGMLLLAVGLSVLIAGAAQLIDAQASRIHARHREP